MTTTPELLKAKHTRYMRKRYQADPVFRAKHKARVKLGKAIRRGIVQRQPCQVCGHETVEAHHPDYSKPLEVQWLCRDCHDEVHGGKGRHGLEPQGCYFNVDVAIPPPTPG